MERLASAIVFVCLISPCSFLVLDGANLQVLNNNVRTALLRKISDAFESANTQMSSTTSLTQGCQSQLSGIFDACAACVNDACDQNFQHCHERRPVTICDVTGANNKVCRGIMNSENLVLDAMWDIDGKMRKVMRRMVQDQEANVVTFLTTIKSFTDRTLTSAESIPIRKSLTTLITYYETVKASVDGGIHHNTALQNSMSSMSKVMKEGMASVGVQMSTRTGNFMTELAFNLARMLATNNPSFGRRKRQAVSCSKIQSFPAHCFAAYATQCSCTGQSASVISEVCSANLQKSIAGIAKPIQAANEIFDKVCIQRNFIEKVTYGNNGVNRQNLGYSNVKYNAVIRGVSFEFTPKYRLQIMDLQQTASKMATDIWNEWVRRTHLM
ncbi:uncharacterized protein LOC110446107 [Mizuhopecten yessoensis]|uniref:Uncharacterized protein n=1 Tax=Mizuhopecten yessoensis TaxID=6573 RepID=A0A210QY30_MIZYE|nr:uncharacterized protein LOC110446107 [Mizuhopecten yessoensis]OWF53667.1 hypothetical protein KP79_PYT24477 [Mizuhopecten yessoensis]